MPLIPVANCTVPVPLVFKVSVTNSESVAPPSVTLAVPDKVTVAVSLSVTFTASVLAVLTEALLVGAARLAVNDSAPSTSRSSVAVTVSVCVSPLEAPERNDCVFEL